MIGNKPDELIKIADGVNFNEGGQSFIASAMSLAYKSSKRRYSLELEIDRLRAHYSQKCRENIKAKGSDNDDDTNEQNDFDDDEGDDNEKEQSLKSGKSIPEVINEKD